MRLPVIAPSELNSEQKPLYDDMRQGIAANFQGFVNVRDDGALLGHGDSPGMDGEGEQSFGLGPHPIYPTRIHDR